MDIYLSKKAYKMPISVSSFTVLLCASNGFLGHSGLQQGLALLLQHEYIDDSNGPHSPPQSKTFKSATLILDCK